MILDIHTLDVITYWSACSAISIFSIYGFIAGCLENKTVKNKTQANKNLDLMFTLEKHLKEFEIES